MRGFLLVGLTGFEPAAYYSRSNRATKLRHSPTLARTIIYQESLRDKWKKIFFEEDR